jgi:hypothetical protein
VNRDWARLPLFDRSGWRTLPFEAFAENITERVEPRDAANEIYVGLDDLDSGDLHVRRWGKGSDVIGTKLRFRKGDVIFGRRRAYQRKLAVAEFDGICSAHAMVVRARPELVTPEYLPFLMMSDRFMNRAIEISVGSLSPTVNWKTLRAQTFELPPIDRQLRLGELLQAIHFAIDQWSTVKADLMSSREASFEKGMEDSEHGVLGDVIVGIVAGKSPQASSRSAEDDEFGVLKVSAVGDGVFAESENKVILATEEFVPDLEVRQGMLLVTRCNASYEGVGRACVVGEVRAGLMLSDKTLQLVPNEDLVDPEFLIQGLRAKPFRQFVRRVSTGTEAKNISQAKLLAAPLWLPSLAKQESVISELREFNALVEVVTQQFLTLVEVQELATEYLVAR